ncbi:hypothetical protein HKCCE3408_04930 [Rhodobacterales bacterium HKCCE3408]|nr:hypothetical protein [Rhodobacterales bacterium HKCCE3408]
MKALSAALTIAAAGPAAAELVCVGFEPRFGLVSDGETARFDYLGDGTFALTAPLPAPLPDLHRTGLVTAGGTVPVLLQSGPCEILGVTQPVSIEILVPRLGDVAVFEGCCRDRRAAG